MQNTRSSFIGEHIVVQYKYYYKTFLNVDLPEE